MNNDSPHPDVREIIAEMEERGVSLTPSMREEINKVLQFAWNRGYKKGYEAGWVAGDTPSFFD